MYISKQMDNIIKILLYLDNQNKLNSCKEIASQIKIPYNMCQRHLQALVKHGFVTPKKGPDGGYEISCNPTTLPLLRIKAVADYFSKPLKFYSQYSYALAAHMCEITIGDLVNTSTPELGAQ